MGFWFGFVVSGYMLRMFFGLSSDFGVQLGFLWFGLLLFGASGFGVLVWVSGLGLWFGVCIESLVWIYGCALGWGSGLGA